MKTAGRMFAISSAADPPAGVRPVVDVDLERDHGEPVAEPGAERGEEEQPEAAVPEQRRRASGIAPQTRISPYGTLRTVEESVSTGRAESASARTASSSGVPTETRIAVGAPNPRERAARSRPRASSRS